MYCLITYPVLSTYTTLLVARIVLTAAAYRTAYRFSDRAILTSVLPLSVMSNIISVHHIFLSAVIYVHS